MLKKQAPQKRRAITEEKLIKAATVLFGRQGYDGSTTKEISRRSGVNESLIIRYFDGKEGLLLETIKRFVERKRSVPLPYPPQKTVEEELVCNARYALADMQQNLDLYKILFGRSTLDAKLRNKINDILPRKGDPRLVERLEKLNASSELLMIIPFQALAAMFLATTALNVEAKPFAESLEELVRSAVRGLKLKGLAGSRRPLR